MLERVTCPRLPRLGLLGLALLLASGCAAGAGGVASPAAATAEAEVPVAITDSGCEPAALSATAGPITFVVTNQSSDTVEFEILAGDRLVAEVENLVPGFVKRLRVRLDGGSYTALCGSRTGPRATLTVAGGPAPAPLPRAGVGQAALAAASAEYKRYVVSEVAQLVEETAAFTSAVAAGDLAAAQARYAPARVRYERIEPIAELFTELDTAIDARVDEYSGPDDPAFTGFHRLEKGLFADQTTAGLAPIAARLDQDVRALQAKVATLDIPPAVMLKGAGELIEEVSQTKITGEEDRSSHTDLWDFAANLEGSRRIFDLARPLLAQTDPALTSSIDEGFTRLDGMLARYRLPDGGYQPYDRLTPDDKRAMQAALAKLAEDLARVPGTLGVE